MNWILASSFDSESGMGHLSRLREFSVYLRQISCFHRVLIRVENAAGERLVKSFFSATDQLLVTSQPTLICESPTVLVYDSIQDPEIQFQTSPRLTVSLSPLYIKNNSVDLVISRGYSYDSQNVIQYSGSEYAIHRNLPVEFTGGKKRVVLHVGGGSHKPRILRILHAVIRSTVTLNDSELICFDKSVTLEGATQKDFDRFVFRSQDIVFTTGGLSLSEALASGLATVNIFLSEKHRAVADPTLVNQENLFDLGLFSELLTPSGFSNATKSLDDNVQNIPTGSQKRCGGPSAVHDRIRSLL